MHAYVILNDIMDTNYRQTSHMPNNKHPVENVCPEVEPLDCSGQNDNMVLIAVIAISAININ